MKNVRGESVFASGALVLLLSLTLFYGCRAFDPEPVIQNDPPDTYIVGAPAETTGTGFRRHLYWYGTDTDGEVVQFIYAITDTSVRDAEDPTTDEEDRRFNPARDVTTVTDNEGFVGWTTRTDSVFVFTVDRESQVQKEITFHIVSVDDRGAIDPSPARLRFFNNALGTPRLQFRLYVEVDPQTGEGGELRWVGDPRNGAAPESPEQTDQPFIGFEVPFRIEWDASTPNVAPEYPNPIRGYRYKAEQGPGGRFVPGVDSLGTKLFGDVQSLWFANNVPGEALGPECNPATAIGCDVSQLRFGSGAYVLSVEAVDQALVQSRQIDGQLRFQMNYPPQTILDRSPTFVVRDPVNPNNLLIERTVFAEGDTVPFLAEVTFSSTGYDRFFDSVPPDERDLFCCDNPLEVGNPEGPPEVRFLERIRALRRTDPTAQPSIKTSPFGFPNPSGTVSFQVAPFEYTFIASTADELDRRDEEPEEFTFFSGFEPRLLPTQSVPRDEPGLRRIVVSSPFELIAGALIYEGQEWATVTQGTAWLVDQPFLDCNKRLTLDEPAGAPAEDAIPGYIVTVNPRFVGEANPRDPRGQVRGWSYRLNSIYDPENRVAEGAESPDLSAFVDSPPGSANVFDFADVDEEARQIRFFVPADMIRSKANMAEYDPGPDGDPDQQAIGCNLLKRLGPIRLEYRGRVTREDDTIAFFENRGPDGSPNLETGLPIGRFGAKTAPTSVDFEIYIGVDGAMPGTVFGDTLIDPDDLAPEDRIWPDEQTVAGLRR